MRKLNFYSQKKSSSNYTTYLVSLFVCSIAMYSFLQSSYYTPIDLHTTLTPTLITYGKLAGSVLFTTIQFLPVVLALMFITKQIFESRGLGKTEMINNLSDSTVKSRLTSSEYDRCTSLKADFVAVNHRARFLRQCNMVLTVLTAVATCFFLSSYKFPAVVGANNIFNTSNYLQYAKVLGLIYIGMNNAMMMLDFYFSKLRNRIYKKYEQLFESKFNMFPNLHVVSPEDSIETLKQKHHQQNNSTENYQDRVDIVNIDNTPVTPYKKVDNINQNETTGATNQKAYTKDSDKISDTTLNTPESPKTTGSYGSTQGVALLQPGSVSDRSYTSPAKTHHSEQNLLSSVDTQSHEVAVSGASTPVQEDSWKIVGSVHPDRDRSKENSNPIVAFWHNGPAALWHNLQSLGKSPVRTSTKNTTNHNPIPSPKTSTSIRQGFDEDINREPGAGDIAPRRLYLEEDLGEKPKR